MAPKLTVNKNAPTPSEEIIQDANRIEHVTDGLGRQIGVRRVTQNVRRRVFKTISDESASRQKYLGMVMVAACVVEIDGEAISLPTTELQFDALIDRLENEGFEAVGIVLKERFGYGQQENIGDIAGE